jgi:hypothetical protein
MVTVCVGYPGADAVKVSDFVPAAADFVVPIITVAVVPLLDGVTVFGLKDTETPVIGLA